LRFIGKVAAYCLPLFPTFCGVCTASASAHDQMKGFDTMLDNIQPDDVLFHELFHAYRCMKGIFEEIPTGDTWDYTEEQMAIIATNVYVSEIGRSSSLRGDHSVPFHSLKENKGSFGDQTVGRNFYNDNFKIVDQMAREMPEFTGPLEKTEAASHVADWNPFRERILFDKGRAMYNTMGSVALDMIVDGHEADRCYCATICFCFVRHSLMRAVQPGSLGNGHVDSNLGSLQVFATNATASPTAKMSARRVAGEIR